MKTVLLRTYVLLLTVFAFSVSEVKATHMMGADISYKCISSLKWEVTINVYRDCRGIPLNLRTGDVRVHCVTSNRTINWNIRRVAVMDITPVSGSGPCNPPNQLFGPQGIEKHVYRGTLDLNSGTFSSFSTCGEIRIEVGQCCRNNVITTGAASQMFYTYATIHTDQSDCNSSPQFVTDPVAYLCCNQPVYLTTGGVDNIDSDSLVYSFADPLRGWNQTISYNRGYSKSQAVQAYYPGSTAPPFSNPNATPPIGIWLDDQTGNFVFTPTRCSEVTVMVIQIDEYRKDSLGKYQKTGTVRRDLQLVINNCQNNNPPTIDIKGGTSINVVPCKNANTTICFEVEAGDRDNSDTVMLTSTALPNGADFKILNQGNRLPRGRFCWSVSDSFINAWGFNRPYYLIFVARDDNNPINAISQEAVRIYFKPTNLSRATLEGYVYADDNGNCAKDASEKGVHKAWIDHASNQFAISDENGKYSTCLDTGTNTVRLLPEPWYQTCGDSTLNFEADSVYRIDLYQKLMNGISGVVEIGNLHCDSVNQPIAGVKVMANPGNYVASTDRNGRYLLKLPPGRTYNLSVISDNQFAPLRGCDSVHRVYLRSNTIIRNKDFSIQPITNKRYKDSTDIQVYLKSGPFLRWGTDHAFQVQLKNKYLESTGNFRVRVRYDSSLIDLKVGNSHPYQVINKGEFVFRASLNPNATTTFPFELHVDTALNKINQRRLFTVIIDSFDSKRNFSATNDTVRRSFDIRASYDPNIKVTYHDSVFTPVHPWLEYNVIFQNTGNDTAYDVIVIDTLPPGLDYESLEVQSASHDYSWVQDHNKLWVYFNDINLLDSASDPEGSIGDFSFRIKVNDTTKSVQHYRNRAAIYFDINPPIFTPYKVNTYYSPVVTDSVDREQYCESETITIDFKSFYPIYHQTHTYALQLSEKGGSFNQPTTLMTLVSDSSAGSFNYVLDDSIPIGNYKFRVIGSYPNAIGFEEFSTQMVFLAHASPDTLKLVKDTFCERERIVINSKNTFENKKLFINGVMADSLGGFQTWVLDTLTGKPEIYLMVSNSAYCFESTDTITLTIHQNPEVSFEADTVLCQKEMLRLWDVSNGNTTVTVDQYQLLPGDSRTFIKRPIFSDTSLSYDRYGRFDLQLVGRSTEGCRDTAVRNILINDHPIADFVGIPDTICNPDRAFDIRDQSTYAVSPFDSVFWDFGDGQTSQGALASHQWAVGSWQVQMIAKNRAGCSDTVVQHLLIHPMPEAKISVNQPVQCLNEHEFELEDLSLPNGSKLLSRSWRLGDGSPSSNQQKFTYKYAREGNYEVEFVFTSEDHCSDTASIDLTVLPSPEAAIGGLPDSICDPQRAMWINDGTKYGVSAVDSVFWDFGDGNTDQGALVSHQWAVGAWQVQMIAKNRAACADTTVQNLVIHPMPEAQIRVNQATQCDEHHLFQLEDVSPLNGGSLLSRTWRLGDGTINGSDQQLTHRYAAVGSYVVDLVVVSEDHCTDSAELNLRIHPSPVANFTGIPDSICDPQKAFALMDQSTYTQSSSDSVFWDFGDGNRANGANVNYQWAAGSWQVQMISRNAIGCEDTAVRELVIHPLPEARIGVNKAIQCFSEHVFELEDLSLLNGGSLLSRHWTLGDGSPADSLQRFTHKYASEGDYEVELIVLSTDFCSDTVQLQLGVSQSPIASFTLNKDMLCEYEQPVIGTFNGMAPVGTEFNWTDGDGGVQNGRDFTNSYANAGKYGIELITVLGNCNDTANAEVEVFFAPEITSFAMEDVCIGEPSLVNWNIEPDTANLSLDLNWGIQSQSLNWPLEKGAARVYASTGNYPIVLEVRTEDGCLDTDTLQHEVFSRPQTAYVYAPLGNGLIRFTSTGTGASDFLWDFGLDNGVEGRGEMIEKQYEENGIYSVSLVSVNQDGCSDTMIQQVNVLLDELFFIPNAFSPNNDNVNDDFRISNSELISELKITLWNRLGVQVWQGTDKDFPLRGLDPSAGQYVYSLDIIDVEGKEHHFKGTIVVVR